MSNSENLTESTNNKAIYYIKDRNVANVCPLCHKIQIIDYSGPLELKFHNPVENLYKQANVAVNLLLKCPDCNVAMIPCDPGIAPIIRRLRELNFRTVMSCESHYNECLAKLDKFTYGYAPWVTVFTPTRNQSRFNVFMDKVYALDTEDMFMFSVDSRNDKGNIIRISVFRDGAPNITDDLRNPPDLDENLFNIIKQDSLEYFINILNKVE